MHDTIQSLDEVAEKRAVNFEDLQPDLETQPQDLKTVPEHTALDTPIRKYSNEVGTSSFNDYTPSILRRRLRMSSQNIISDPNKGTKNRSS